MNRYYKKHRGIGLLELLLSLVVIITILFISGRYYRVARTNLRVTKAIAQIRTITSASYKWVEGKPNFAGLASLGTLVEAGLLPENYRHARNPWYGEIKIASADKKTNQTVEKDAAIKLTFTHAGLYACQNLLTKLQRYTQNAQCNSNGDFSGVF